MEKRIKDNTDDYCVESTFDFDRNDEYAVKELDNEGCYESDFTTMIGILDKFDQANNTTKKHIHELLQNINA